MIEMVYIAVKRLLVQIMNVTGASDKEVSDGNEEHGNGN